MLDNCPMPRRVFKRINRSRHIWREHWILKPFRKVLSDPAYWSLNRRSVTRAFAIGLFIACSPLPTHMIPATLVALVLRINLPVILATLFVTNPLTIVPLYFFEYWLGCKLLGLPLQPFSFEMSHDWFVNHLLPVWKPFLLGSLVTSLVAALVGYVALGLVWHLSLVLKYHRRKNTG
jgi:uncharacterized protein (DUF2062 family)